jgi:hypothetical protein
LKLFNYGFWEPAHFIMERKMLLTLKESAETMHNAAEELEKLSLDVADTAAA